MTAMEAQPAPTPHTESVPPPQPVVAPLAPPMAPPPPPPPGCQGGIQLPHWRSEPLPSHLAPTKEQIDKEQYANLPDKLLNAMNKDKKPFTYTPSGVSGIEKGKLDLSSIRSPKMKKRLLANLVDEEDSDLYEPERVTRSETPEVSAKQKPQPDNRRAITPDMQMKSMYAPVLPPISKEMLSQRPVVNKFKSEEELEAYVKKQMTEMENSFKNQKNKFNGLEPEVQELIDSYKHVQPQQQSQPEQQYQPQPQPLPPPRPQPQSQPQSQPEPERTLPIEVEDREESLEPIEPKYSLPESTKPAVDVEETFSYRMDYNKNPINESEDRKSGNNGINCRIDRDNRNDSKRHNTNNNDNPWDSDLLRHVLDGGLQEEIEKFEKISLETQKSFKSPKRNDNFYESQTTPTFETFGRSLPNPSPVWDSYGSSQDSYVTANQTPSPYGSLNRNVSRNEFRSPQPYDSPCQSIASARQFWSESPSPSPHRSYERETASVEPVYRSPDIPSNQFMPNKRSGISISQVPNYNTRPKPFYLCSPPSTPAPTPPPPVHQSVGPQRSHEHQFTTFGKNIAPQKISYQSELANTGMDSMPSTQYIESIGMYAQTKATDGWKRPASPPATNQRGGRSLDRNITFSDRVITSPDRSGLKSPELPKPILKKKLPPSERPPDPTPSKYMGGNIPCRSFRILQLMTGEDIDNQFAVNQLETKSHPKNSYETCKQFNKTVGYSNYEDFGTDF